MREFALLIAYVLLVKGETSCKQSISEIDGKTRCKGETVFLDNFNQLDLAKWRQSLQISGEDYEFVTYKADKENTYVKDGKLFIVPTVQDDDYVQDGLVNFTTGCTGKTTVDCARLAKFHQILPPVNSGRICTKSAFKYGKFTIRAKFPSGDWIIPQLYLQPTAEAYGPWYMSGRMMIASAHGGSLKLKDTYEDIGPSLLKSGLIIAKNPEDKNPKARFAKVQIEQPYHLRSHEFTFVWSPDEITFYTDGLSSPAVIYESGSDRRNLYETMSFTPQDNPLLDTGSQIAPFDKESNICLGVSVGGHYGIPDKSIIHGKIKPWTNFDIKGMYMFWSAKSSWQPSWSEDSALIVDYVKVKAL